MEVARFHIPHIAMILLYFLNQKERRKNPTTWVMLQPIFYTLSKWKELNTLYYISNYAINFMTFPNKVESTRSSKWMILHMNTLNISNQNGRYKIVHIIGVSPITLDIISTSRPAERLLAPPGPLSSHTRFVRILRKEKLV